MNLFFKMLIAWAVFMLFVLMMGLSRKVSRKQLITGLLLATGIFGAGMGVWFLLELIKKG